MGIRVEVSGVENRLATTLIHQMARTGASRGIASLCVGVGQGLATVFERE